jgi:GH15 family glucan-1,4-alpha-glucosidase
MRPTARATAIGDYGFLSDCHAAALVDRTGSIDWWCGSRFDSPSIFGRLLGADAGHWSLRPRGESTAQRCYVPDSLVLRTTFTTATGQVAVTDALGLELGARGHGIGLGSPHVLLRGVEGIRGEVEMAVEFCPRMEYGLTVPNVTRTSDGVLARGGPICLTLTGPVELATGGGAATGQFTVRAGDALGFRLDCARSAERRQGAEQPQATIADTIEAWRSWAHMHDGYQGRHRDAVRRSSMVLQGLTYQPTGAVVAAATTSLPEKMGADSTSTIASHGCAT